ncbi:uracil-DNA glycosylase-like [Ruditapes philippinarum]|uniref:uracil-DNA glycosylase-like n=1 Tax=Ruditapes philippinarum TaxID=129788 RepID=UPI00295A8E6F|nr:uracil-DNA glycosylase-like [Ruditapes philippinarum]
MLKEGIKDPAWQRVLEEEFRQPYFTELEEKLADEYDSGELIYPDKTRIFQAFNLTPFYEVRIVMLGNEPYTDATPISDYSQTVPKANGLAFSVPFEMSTIPRTLQNIYKELVHDIGFLIPTHGCLEKWAQEGVLLLNEKLTVRASMPRSHDNIGWQTFTDNVIKGVSDNLSHVVFLLWGNAGKRKEGLIDDSKHTVIKTDHPSDKQGDFHNSCCFSQSNFALVMKGQHPIDWTLRQETFDNVFI